MGESVLSRHLRAAKLHLEHFHLTEKVRELADKDGTVSLKNLRKLKIFQDGER